MRSLTITLTVVLAVIFGVIFFVVAIYNRLVTLRNLFKNSFAQIDVQLKRRYDLIPNLVEVAREYMKHEHETLTAVIEARNQAAGAAKKASANPSDALAIGELVAAEGLLSGSLGQLFALAEAYPTLQANQNMMKLSEELSSTENRIAFARQAFNDSVMSYNTAQESFPAVIFAEMFGFTPAKFLELDSKEDRKNPKVSF